MLRANDGVHRIDPEWTCCLLVTFSRSLRSTGDSRQVDRPGVQLGRSVSSQLGLLCSASGFLGLFFPAGRFGVLRLTRAWIHVTPEISIGFLVEMRRPGVTLPPFLRVGIHGRLDGSDVLEK